MPTEIRNYRVYFYGGPDGYLTNRAQIELFGTDGKIAGYVRFNDPGMQFENDTETGGAIRMHLPSSMFQSILDVLRNEKPVFIYYAQNRGFLTTSKEPAGEGE